MQKIFLDSESGKTCCNFEHVTASTSCVIILHGYLSDKTSRTGTELALRLNQAGISTIAVDLYGHGESEGDIEHLTLSKAIANSLAVHDFIKKEGFIKIGLVGSSFSGLVSLVVATKRPITVLSLKCPAFDYSRLWRDRLGEDGLKKWKELAFIEPFDRKMHYEMYDDSLLYDPHKIAAKISIPTLVIHGDKDVTVPSFHAQELISSVKGEKRLVLIKGADHFFKDKNHFEEMVSTSFEWLKKNL